MDFSSKSNLTKVKDIKISYHSSIISKKSSNFAAKLRKNER